MTLADRYVHLWHARLDELDDRAEESMAALSPEERERAERLRFRRDRRRFLAGRSILRDILARYLGAAPAELSLRYDPNGKPRLAGRFGGSGLEFNLAHSEGVALYAVARGRQVGVDLEMLRPVPGEEGVAGVILSPGEKRGWDALRTEDRTRALLRYWTCKEAFLKASGEGLSRAPEGIELQLDEERGARVTQVAGDEEAGSRWELLELAPVDGCLAALVVEGRGCRVQRWHWSRPWADPSV